MYLITKGNYVLCRHTVSFYHPYHHHSVILVSDLCVTINTLYLFNEFEVTRSQRSRRFISIIYIGGVSLRSTDSTVYIQGPKSRTVSCTYVSLFKVYKSDKKIEKFRESVYDRKEKGGLSRYSNKLILYE